MTNEELLQPEDVSAYRFTKRIIGKKYTRFQYVVTYNDKIIERFSDLGHWTFARVKDGKCQGCVLAGLEGSCPPEWILIPVKMIKNKEV